MTCPELAAATPGWRADGNTFRPATIRRHLQAAGYEAMPGYALRKAPSLAPGRGFRWRDVVRSGVAFGAVKTQ